MLVAVRTRTMIAIGDLDFYGGSFEVGTPWPTAA
jgi:hypothetical protein